LFQSTSRIQNPIGNFLSKTGRGDTYIRWRNVRRRDHIRKKFKSVLIGKQEKRTAYPKLSGKKKEKPSQLRSDAGGLRRCWNREKKMNSDANDPKKDQTNETCTWLRVVRNFKHKLTPTDNHVLGKQETGYRGGESSITLKGSKAQKIKRKEKFSSHEPGKAGD